MKETVTPSMSASSESAVMVYGKQQYLTDPKAMTLYTYDKDTANTSNCYGSCAILWPPFLTTSTQLKGMTMPGLTTIKRTDGSMQYAYNGKPLYYYQKDTKPGDVTGDGVGGVWHIVKP